ncbi:unnamed protein product [Rhizophagus irregularis]|nr:unnamed protein product [Rhizophagus irregularis]
MMKNHKESKFWFTSLIGFFYQHGIGCKLNKEKALDFYLLVINNDNNNEIFIDNEKIEKQDFLNENFNKLVLVYSIENNNDIFNSLKNKNIIIGKYLLSLFYHKDIIIDIECFNYYYYQNSKQSNDQNELMKLVKLAKNGNLNAQYNLAVRYMDGIGIQKNEEKAFEWFLKTEQSGHLITQDKKEKEEFYKHLKLAIAGDSMALFYVGYCYQYGKGISKNEIKAFEWYTKSANAGYADGQSISGSANGQCKLGYCYDHGIGTEKNEIKAFEWYFKSAENESMVKELLKAKQKHLNGTNKDEVKAFVWYLKSAEGGIAEAQNYVGKCYFGGIGIYKDIDRAIYYWYGKASDNGIKEAKDKLANILSFLP